MTKRKGRHFIHLTFDTVWASPVSYKLRKCFSENRNLTVHANCLLMRQFAWNVKPYFMGKLFPLGKLSSEETVFMIFQTLFLLWRLISGNVKPYFLGKNKKTTKNTWLPANFAQRVLKVIMHLMTCSLRKDSDQPIHPHSLTSFSCQPWPQWLRRRHIQQVIRSSRFWSPPDLATFLCEIFSMVILFLLLIQEGQFSVSCQRMCTSTG